MELFSILFRKHGRKEEGPHSLFGFPNSRVEPLTGSKKGTWETENSPHMFTSKSHFIDLAVKILCVQILKEFSNGGPEKCDFKSGCAFLIKYVRLLHTLTNCSVPRSLQIRFFSATKMQLFLWLLQASQASKLYSTNFSLCHPVSSGF